MLFWSSESERLALKSHGPYTDTGGHLILCCIRICGFVQREEIYHDSQFLCCSLLSRNLHLFSLTLPSLTWSSLMVFIILPTDLVSNIVPYVSHDSSFFCECVTSNLPYPWTTLPNLDFLSTPSLRNQELSSEFAE